MDYTFIHYNKAKYMLFCSNLLIKIREIPNINIQDLQIQSSSNNN